MMNPYQLNWPGLRDVPVVTVDTEAAVIYSQENLLPLKRGKLDRLEYKYVPIEAVLDEFNAEIELEEAFETLESILDIPGVKPLYTDKTSGRKYVHVSSLLALIVLRPDDGPGFETACHSILHFLMNHLEMACLECGFIRRDCLCQVYDVCLDPKNIECVSYAKESAEKDVQTDPVKLDAGFPRAAATTVYLPRGANLSNCERLPDGSLNIKYMKADGKGEVVTQPQAAGGAGPPAGLMLPPGSHYVQGAGLQAGFVPPSVPVCHPGGLHPLMTSSPYLPMTTSPLSMMSTMLPTSSIRPMASAMYAGPMYPPGVRAFYPNGPVITSAPCPPPGQYQARAAMPPPPAPSPPTKPNNTVKKTTIVISPKSKPLKRSHEKQTEVTPPPKAVSLLKKKKRKSVIVPLKEGGSEDSGDKPKVAGRKTVTLKRVSTDTDKENTNDSGKDSEVSVKDSGKGKVKNEKDISGTSGSDTKEKKKSDVQESNKEKHVAENGANKEQSCDSVEGEKTDSQDSKDGAKVETNKEALTGEEKGGDMVTRIKEEETEENGLEMATDEGEQADPPAEVDMAPDGGPETCPETPTRASPTAPAAKPKADATELFVRKSPETSKGWDVFEYAPTGQQMIRCLCCGQCFDKENYAEKHTEMHTEQKSLRCVQCEYTVSASRWYTLLRHLYSKHSTAFVDQDNSCKLCGNVFDTLEGLEEHVDVHHYNKYKCTYCGTSLLTWDAYQHHVAQCAQVAQGKTYYSCPYCHFAFRDRLMKQVHVKSHQDDALVCCYCRDGKDWGNWKALKNHYELLHLPKVKDRNPKKAKACPRCSQVFKSYKGFRNHVAKCTGPKVVAPKAKGEETSDTEGTAGKKEAEEGGEGGEKEAKEGEAEKSDVEEKENKKSTEGEEKNEEGESKKPTAKMKKRFKQKGQLKCDKCHKKFGAASTLDRHMAYAHGPESACDECSHVAKTPMLLKMHKTLKHSEKRHICSECNRTFMYYHQYKVHLAWHARKVAYACPTCDAEFPRQMELRQHQLKDHPTANNRTVFTCSSCDFKCFSRTTLRAHLRNKHLSSDEDEDGGSERAFRPSADEDGGSEDGGREGSGSGEGTDTASSDSSDVDEEDLSRLFSWRQSRPAPEGARRSQRTPKPSTKLKDIARTRKISQRKKQLPSKRGRKRSTSGRRAPPSPRARSPSPAPAIRRRRPGLKGRPPLKRALKARRIKKEKVEKKVKLRRCGCARFRTFAEFKILKKRQEEKRIVETTIVEDATLPMRRRTTSTQSEPEVCRPPRAEVPETSWTYDLSLTTLSLSAEQQQRLGNVVLDHCYYQRPGPPPETAKAQPEPSVSDTTAPTPTPASPPALGSPGRAAGAGRGRKRLASSGSSGGPAAAAQTGQSPAKVRATVNDLESAIKFADNINQLSKLVSILRADKEDVPAGTTFLQSPPRGTRLVPAAQVPAGGAGPAHPAQGRPSALDYEVGDIEPLPSDIMASEMESDIDMQGVMSEILEEMGQNAAPGDDSGVSADVSQAAEVLLSLDMSAEERELVADLAPPPPAAPARPAPSLPPPTVQYVPSGQDILQEAIRTTGALENGDSQEGQQGLEEQEQEQEQEQDQGDEPVDEVEVGGAGLQGEEGAGDGEEDQEVENTLVVKTVPLTSPKVAVELTNVNIPHSDFLFWAAKHDDTDEVAAGPPEGEGEEELAEVANTAGERTTWQLDHQYF